MKKYSIAFLLAIIIGFFLALFFINQYDDYKGIKVSSTGESLYFIQYGVFSSVESMEENTISLQNYIYNIDNDLFYVYVGITKEKENAEKIQNYFNNLGFDTIIKNYDITNKEFLKIINTYDEIMKNTDDNTVIASIINQTLIKYEEVVNSGG